MAFLKLASLTLALILLSGLIIPSHAGGNITIYWGQNGYEMSLLETCARGNFEIVIVAFISAFGHGTYPTLNLAGHCDPGSNTCTKFSPEINYCQDRGIKVLISIGGGGSGVYYFSSSNDAEQFALYLWNHYLGGSSQSRPLGEAVLDGVDFAIIDGPYSDRYYDVLAKTLSSFSSSERKVYLSAAPQCADRPDTWIRGTLQTGLFDYVWVQFYNNPGCNYQHDLRSTNFENAWKIWTSDTTVGAPIYLGLPAAPTAASNGFISVEDAITVVLPLVKKYDKYGGVMLWDEYYDQITYYSSEIKPYAYKLHQIM